MSEKSLVERLAEELKEEPSRAVLLLESMESVVRPWEEVKVEGQGTVNSYRRLSAMGEVVATIHSSAPTWILTVKGERYLGDKVFHRKGAELRSMQLLDKELSKLGYVLMDSKE